jgi:hypothetical protein
VTSPAALRQLPFLNCEDRALLHLDVAHDANAADLIAELYIVASGFDACDSQALVMVDRSIPIILALVGSVVIVYKVRFQKRMPLRSCAATEEATSPNAIKASNTARILASRKLMHRLPSASE